MPPVRGDVSPNPSTVAVREYCPHVPVLESSTVEEDCPVEVVTLSVCAAELLEAFVFVPTKTAL
jgi:hypothetical protein